MKVVVKAENLGKVYAINHEANVSRSLGATLESGLRKLVSLGRAGHGRERAPEALEQRRSVEQFRALDDISFEIRQGDRVGVLGRNGAGKSTLLKIISRVVEPTSGSLTLRGRIASLLEVGTGFHPELTGRENVFLNGAILGMSRGEIARKFDEIVDFAEIERFIDTPVKFYSSGMYVRLAFSVSAHLEPDILILDEVLAVGDMRFQRKCIDKMQLAGREGRTLMFVSHSTQAIIQTCKTALYLKEGRLHTYGPVETAVGAYTLDNVIAAPAPPTPESEAAVAAAAAEQDDDEDSVDEWLQGEYVYKEGDELYREVGDFADFIGARLLDAAGAVSARLPIHQPIRCVMRYRVRRNTPFRLVPNFHFYLEDGRRFFIAFPEHVAPTDPGEYDATCIVPPFLINTGRYTVTLCLSSYDLPNPVHFASDQALRFEVFEPPDSDPRRHGWNGGLPGVSRPHLDWEISKT
jgi:lipopolysaccharide transport system ATP-binding protein